MTTAGNEKGASATPTPGPFQITRLFEPAIVLSARPAPAPPTVTEDSVRSAYVRSLEMYRDILLKYFSEKGVPMGDAEIEKTRDEVMRETGDALLEAPNFDDILNALHAEMRLIEGELQDAFEASAVESLKMKITELFQYLADGIDAEVIGSQEELKSSCDAFIEHLRSEEKVPSAVWEQVEAYFDGAVRVPLADRLRRHSDPKGKGPARQGSGDKVTGSLNPPSPASLLTGSSLAPSIESSDTNSTPHPAVPSPVAAPAQAKAPKLPFFRLTTRGKQRK
ncbi:hypothetical protein HK405_005771 [Cladochytrium tenue]|nr:hypothetical protein HK405_005771 [Cladochytrium tenue]